MERRQFIAGTGLAIAVAGAGCLGGTDDEPDTTDDPQGVASGTDTPDVGSNRTTDNPGRTTDERTGSDGDGEETTVADETALKGAEAIPFGTANEPSGWDSETDDGRVVVIDSEARARAALPVSKIPEGHRDTVGNFVSETDFERSVLVFVESAGPNSCYGELTVENVTLSNGTLQGSATAVDGSDGGICAEVVTFPSALLRATFEGTPVTSATFSVTDGWENTASLTATADDSLSRDPADLPGYVRPDGDPPAVPDPLSCSEDFNRHPNWVEDPPWGTVEHDGETAFALRADTRRVSYGDTVTITLTNVGDRQFSTGNRYKYSLQVKTTDGWQDVRGASDRKYFEYTDEALIHRPGEGLEWTFEMTESGVVADHIHDLEVCPDLQTGRYRFVFFEPGVAVAFDFEG